MTSLLRLFQTLVASALLALTVPVSTASGRLQATNAPWSSGQGAPLVPVGASLI